MSFCRVSGCGEEKSGCGEEKSGCGEEKSGCGEEKSGCGEEKSEKLYFGATVQMVYCGLVTSIESLKGALLSDAFLNWEPFEDVKHNSSHIMFKGHNQGWG